MARLPQARFFLRMRCVVGENNQRAIRDGRDDAPRQGRGSRLPEGSDQAEDPRPARLDTLVNKSFACRHAAAGRSRLTPTARRSRGRLSASRP